MQQGMRLDIYTDGSVVAKRYAGCSFVLWTEENKWDGKSIPLGESNDIDAAELEGIAAALDFVVLCHQERKLIVEVSICSDSQTALGKVGGLQAGAAAVGELEKNVAQSLRILAGLGTTVRCVKVKAHSGIAGNEEADLKALQAAKRSQWESRREIEQLEKVEMEAKTYQQAALNGEHGEVARVCAAKSLMASAVLRNLL